MRLQRGSVVGWGAGLACLATAYGSITDSINDFVQDNESLSDIIAAQGQGTITEQYLAMSFRVLALVAAAFAIQSTLRIRGEEASTHAEPVLATPVSRTRWVASHLAIAFGATVVLLLVTGLSFGISDAAVTGDAGAIAESVVGAMVYSPAVWVLVGLTALIIGVAPRASTVVPWTVLGICFVIGMFGQLLDIPAAIQDLSPFQRVPEFPASGLDVLPVAVLTVIAAALTAAGIAGVRRRDIG
jgi:ABC-2 type transport system permease protein